MDDYIKSTYNCECKRIKNNKKNKNMIYEVFKDDKYYIVKINRIEKNEEVEDVVELQNNLAKNGISNEVILYSTFTLNNKNYFIRFYDKMEGDLFKNFNEKYIDDCIKIIYTLIYKHNIFYNDIKLANFLINNRKIYLTDFDDGWIEKIINDDDKDTIFSISLYLLYLSCKKFNNNIKIHFEKNKLFTQILSPNFKESLTHIFTPLHI